MKIEGAAETAQAMRKLAGLLAPALNESAKRALEPTLALAKDLAPRETGTLRRSLILRRLKASPKTSPEYVVGVNPKTRGKGGRRPINYASRGGVRHRQDGRAAFHDGGLRSHESTGGRDLRPDDRPGDRKERGTDRRAESEALRWSLKSAVSALA